MDQIRSEKGVGFAPRHGIAQGTDFVQASPGLIGKWADDGLIGGVLASPMPPPVYHRLARESEQPWGVKNY